MSEATPHSRSAARSRLAKSMAAFGSLCLAASLALAGECPADKCGSDGQGRKPGPMSPVSVTNGVRSRTDLSKEPAAVPGRQFRPHQLDAPPGGVVPWHSRDNRPATIYLVSDEIYEYAGNCAVPTLRFARPAVGRWSASCR